MNLAHLRLCWRSALKVSEKMEKFPICISTNIPVRWQSVKLGWMTGHLMAEWCQLAPGHSQWTGNPVLCGSSTNVGSAVPSGLSSANQQQRYRFSTVAEIKCPFLMHCSLPQDFPFYPLIQAAGK